MISRGAGPPLFSAFVAGPAFAVGARLADRVWAVVLDPARRQVLTFAILAGLCSPAVTDAVDHYLHARTP